MQHMWFKIFNAVLSYIDVVYVVYTERLHMCVSKSGYSSINKSVRWVIARRIASAASWKASCLLLWQASWLGWSRRRRLEQSAVDISKRTRADWWKTPHFQSTSVFRDRNARNFKSRNSVIFCFRSTHQVNKATKWRPSGNCFWTASFVKSSILWPGVFVLRQFSERNTVNLINMQNGDS